MKLFEPYLLGKTELKNRVAMAPMTRCRAIGNIPNDLMATFYGQRAGAGLLITEGTSPSPNGLGYARQPGAYSEDQEKGWKKVANAVHANDGKIFIQFMHTGRVGHPFNLPAGARILAPSALKIENGQMFTDAAGMQDMPVPEAMTAEDIRDTIGEFIHSATAMVRAGIDGVELHGANGYLLEQFISPISNQRTDEYGGSIENRCRIVLEIAEGLCKTIGKECTAIRFSPYGLNGGMAPYTELHETYVYLAEKLNELGIVYIHLVDHSSMGAPEVPMVIKQSIRNAFHNTLMLSGGYNKERAEADLDSGLADLIAFGRPFITNPDFVERLKHDLPLNNELDMATFYTPGEKGYTDYKDSV
jgi:N-ethylmaleimide reductase